MKKLLQELESLRQGRTDLGQAIANVRADIQSPENPHGNLTPPLVLALEQACSMRQTAQEAIADHRSDARPALHRQCAPTERVSRAMARSDFISYHVLGRLPSALANESYWATHLAAVGTQQLEGPHFRGRTGCEGQPCWWRLEETGRRPPEDGRAHATALALSEDTHRRAEKDGALVEVTLASDLAADVFFKPTSLEGFGANTLFRPELTGSSHGRTVPTDPALTGWPEAVSRSAAYEEILGEDTEVTVRVLPYRPQ
ncbi:MAG: hypothetical protein HC897_07125 [Thermoanaerobaculia bacterium]|nr:hypothetical protein [Thermoanaerobaculia bacterium]